MDGLLSLKNDSITIAPSTKILRREVLFSLNDAADVIRKSKAEANELIEKANLAYKEQYAAGFAEGKEEGLMEYSEKLMDVALESLDALSEIEERMVDVVVAAVSKILGQFSADELTVSIIKNSLGQLRGEKRILVRVCHEDENAVRMALKDFLISNDGSTGYIEVAGDLNLKRNDCVIETSLGIIDSSLATQLKTLERLFKAQFVLG